MVAASQRQGVCAVVGQRPNRLEPRENKRRPKTIKLMTVPRPSPCVSCDDRCDIKSRIIETVNCTQSAHRQRLEDAEFAAAPLSPAARKVLPPPR